MVILSVTGGIFILSLFVLPIIANGFGESSIEFNQDGIKDDVTDGVDSVNTINAFNVLLSFLTLGLIDISTTFALPVFMEIIFSMIFYTFVITVVRNVWIGGGA